MNWGMPPAHGVGETILDRIKGLFRRERRPWKRMGRNVIHPDAAWGSWSAGYHPPTMPEQKK